MKSKSIDVLTKVLSTMLIITIFVHLSAVIFNLYEYYLGANTLFEVDLKNVIHKSESISSKIGLFKGLSIFVAAITFFIWIHRININLHLLSNEEMRFGPNWSVAWFFIPIANVFMPYKVLKELWLISFNDDSSDYGLVRRWWTLFIFSRLFAVFSIPISFNANYLADNISKYKSSAVLNSLSNGLDLFIAIGALMLIQRISKEYSINYAEQKHPPEPIRPQ